MSAMTTTDTRKAVGRTGIAFTVATSTAGPLNKSLKYEGGKLTAKASAYLSSGTVQTRHAASLEELRDVIESLTPHQAIIWGVTGRDGAVPITTKARRKDAKEVSRTKDCFTYPSGFSWVSLDFDQPKESEALTPESAWGVVVEVMPELEGVGRLVLGSSKSGLRYDGKPISDRDNFRIIFGLEGGNPNAFADVLVKRLFVAGHGRIDISKSGALLPRTVFDRAAIGPERLDFLALPTLSAGLTQDRLCKIEAGPWLRWDDVAPITKADDDTFDSVLARLKGDAAPLAAEKRKQRMADESALLVRGGVDHDTAQERVRRKYECSVLEGAERITLSDGVSVSVSEICANPGKFRGLSCYDPTDDASDTEADCRIAKIVWDGRSFPAIRSFAHGGRTWFLKPHMRHIQIRDGDAPEAARQAIATLVEANAIYHRGGRFTGIRANGSMCFFDERLLTLTLETHISWQKKNAREQTVRSVNVPDRIVKSVLASDAYAMKVPEIVAVSDVPLLRADGTLAQAPGYDAALKQVLTLDPEEWEGLIPDAPTESDACAAFGRVWDQLKDFPFAGAADRGGMVAALFTAILRDVLPTSPMFIITATAPGSGKSLLCSILQAVRGGSARTMPPFRRDAEEELQKGLGAMLAEGVRTVTYDNLTTTVKSDVMCAFVSGAEYGHRTLQQSATHQIANRMMVLVNGNGVHAEGDAVRRSIQIALDAGVERAWGRHFEGDVLAWFRAGRVGVVADLLTILRAYECAGRPGVAAGALGGFEPWCRAVRAPLLWLATLPTGVSIGDPIAKMLEAHDTDADTLRLQALLEGWRERYPTGATIANVRKAWEREQDAEDPFFEAVADVAVVNGRFAPRVFGAWLRTHAGRIARGMRFQRGGDRGGSALWVVVNA